MGLLSRRVRSLALLALLLCLSIAATMTQVSAMDAETAVELDGFDDDDASFGDEEYDSDSLNNNEEEEEKDAVDSLLMGGAAAEKLSMVVQYCVS